MFCPNCGSKTEKDARFCQSCGSKNDGFVDDSIKTVSVDQSQTEITKNYSPIFWRYFWGGVLLNIFSRGVDSVGGDGLWIILLILVGIYIYKFSKTINEAMASIGKNNWWPLGLLALIPLGFWIAFLIVRAKLQPYGKWVSNHKSFRLTKKS